METVHKLVQKLQYSLYNKTFPNTVGNSQESSKEHSHAKKAEEEERTATMDKAEVHELRKVNPTPLAHSAESGVFSSTQPTTEPAKGKEEHSDREGKVDGQSLRVSQLKVDDVHIERLKFPSKTEPQETGRMPEIVPQIQIDGVTSRS